MAVTGRPGGSGGGRVTRCELRMVRPPHRRIARVDSDVDPDDAGACVLLLRRLAEQYHRDPAEVILRVQRGRTWHDYHA